MLLSWSWSTGRWLLPLLKSSSIAGGLYCRRQKDNRVASHRPKNAKLRTREHLTVAEVEGLIQAASNNRHGHRDALMIRIRPTKWLMC